tara:strand:+ start:3740 stop:4267 length:528 start_codon:yes stop_codon:yes gene_type:complete
MKATEYEGAKVPEGATHLSTSVPVGYFCKFIGKDAYFFFGQEWKKSNAYGVYIKDNLTELPEQNDRSIGGSFSEIEYKAQMTGKSIPCDVIEHDNNNKYSRKIKTIVVDGIDHDIYVDVYDVLAAFKTDNSAVDHAVKKELAPGVRGVKSRIQDFMEARDSLNRAIEIEKAKGGE